MLDLKLLTTFREVALRRSFSDAASALGYTQPAVSQHVARLEAALGARLLDRDARGVSPTPAGELLLLRAATLLDAARRAEEDVRSAAGIGRATVCIGAFPTLAAGLLPGATRDLRARRPDLRLDVRLLEPAHAIDELVVGRLGLATLVDSELQPMGVRPGVEHVHLCDDPLLLVMAAEHPLAGRASIGLEELSEEPWLLPEVGGTCADSNIVLRACRDAGFEPDVRLAFDDYSALQGMAAAGVGIALIPSLSTANIRSDVAVRPLRGRAPQRRIQAAVRVGEADPLVDHVIEALRAAARALPGGRALTAVA
ncbi:LysR family transcriptional regulator [Baekduia soli]|uniref:LysR family transcriptional regulator n=1 Tax=Baekduia soli TaxID=496014 RepID=A0A5B8U3E1_9ACTN|nr:LysR family transcriptional regulator [Baekduia soli]QEC47472.1 LysR family transcriptional regulator [Baekduia soli]